MPDSPNRWSALSDARLVLFGAALVVPAIMALSCCGGCVLLGFSRPHARPIASGDLGVALVPETQPVVIPVQLDDESVTQANDAVKVREDIDRKVAAAAGKAPNRLRAGSMASGEIGVFQEPIKILQVLGDRKFLADVGYPAHFPGGVPGMSHLVLFSVREGADLVDDRYWLPGGRWFYVLGPTTYTTALGTDKTVMSVMEIEPPSASVGH